MTANSGNLAAAPSQQQESSLERKLKKPLMEKRRRARMNKSLMEIKAMLLQNSPGPQGAKLEKADILEMAVQHLKLAKAQLGGAAHKSLSESSLTSQRQQFIEGYKACVEASAHFMATNLNQVPGATPTTSPYFPHQLFVHLQQNLSSRLAAMPPVAHSVNLPPTQHSRPPHALSASHIPTTSTGSPVPVASSSSKHPFFMPPSLCRAPTPEFRLTLNSVGSSSGLSSPGSMFSDCCSSPNSLDSGECTPVTPGPSKPLWRPW